jgi:hypothetical protein
MTNAPGKSFLKVSGILYIVFFGIDIMMVLGGLDNPAIGSMLESALGYPLFFQFIGDLFGVFIGIMGVKYCAVLEKAKFLATLVIIDLSLSVIQIIISSLWMSLLWYAVPILYLIGAVKNKKAFEANLAASSEDNVE